MKLNTPTVTISLTQGGFVGGQSSERKFSSLTLCFNCIVDESFLESKSPDILVRLIYSAGSNYCARSHLPLLFL